MMWTSPHDVTAPDRRPIAERVTPRAGWLLAVNVIGFAFVALTVRTVGAGWSSWVRIAAFAALSAALMLLWVAQRRTIRRAAERAGEISPV